MQQCIQYRIPPTVSGLQILQAIGMSPLALLSDGSEKNLQFIYSNKNGLMAFETRTESVRGFILLHLFPQIIQYLCCSVASLNITLGYRTMDLLQTQYCRRTVKLESR